MMFRRRRLRRRLAKVQPGDGSPLEEFRLWHGSHRSLFYLDDVVDRHDGSTVKKAAGAERHVYAVDVHHLTDELPRSFSGDV